MPTSNIKLFLSFKVIFIVFSSSNFYCVFVILIYVHVILYYSFRLFRLSYFSSSGQLNENKKCCHGKFNFLYVFMYLYLLYLFKWCI